MDAVFHTSDLSPTCDKYLDMLTTDISQKNEIFEGTPHFADFEEF